jgi:pantetheine-phosphate adenylyltransferase
MRTKALYPGTFDPITCGHVDIVKRGLNMFDEIIVAVARNIRKNPIFSIEERIEMIKESFANEPRVSVVTLEDGLLVDFAISQGIHTVLRGLRAMSDFEYEFQMASMNRRLSDQVDYVFLMTSEENFFVSSSLIREVAINHGKIEGFVPEPVVHRLRNKFKKD